MDDTSRRRCPDCEIRYAVGRSPRCTPCKKRRARRTRHNAHLKSRYGIGIVDYDKMSALSTPAGTCHICGGGTSYNFLATDHNHRTGEVRGLLCATCNKALRNFRDNADRFRAAADYLDNPPSRQVLKKRDWSRFADNRKSPKQKRNRR